MKKITFKSISEKLKKYIIEPEPEILFDDMEDDTGLNGTGIEECMTAAQMGPAPTPNLGRKSIVKTNKIDDIKKELEDIDEEINGDVQDPTQTLIDWLDKLNFRPTKYDKGIRYTFGGNYNHYIIWNNNKLNYQINNDGRIIYTQGWTITDDEDINDAFKQISKVFDSYE
jgi:hypothetical protein